MGNLTFWYYHSQRFENVDYVAMYSHIFTDNILICHNDIYQVLKHVCVFSPYAFRGKYYNLSWINDFF